MDQVRDIFSGATTNWSEVGGPDRPITPVQLAQGSGTRNVFESRIFGNDVPGAVPNAVTAEGTAELAAVVNADENAVGYVSYAFQRGAKAISLTNECGIPMVPDAFSAKTGEYVLSRSLYFYTSDNTMTPETQALVDYVNSGEADQIIGKSGFIDLGIAEVDQGQGTERYAQLQAEAHDPYERTFVDELLGLMDGYDRLSSTFRFRTGSDRLTARGRVDLDRLTTHLSGLPSGSEVLLVGFTDDRGVFDGNRAVAKERADQVAAELRDAGGAALEGLNVATAGFGSILPAACNDSVDGRAINRRVEVWVKS